MRYLILILLLLNNSLGSAQDAKVAEATQSIIQQENKLFFDHHVNVTLIDSISAIEGKFHLSSVIKDEYKTLPAYTITTNKGCYIHNDHYDGMPDTDPNKPFYRYLTWSGHIPNSPNDLYWITFWHEYAHCAQEHKQPIPYKKSIYFHLLNNSKAPYNKKSISIAVNNAYEAVADTFALLKVQKDYLNNNYTAIQNGFMPLLNPEVFMFAVTRDTAARDGIDLDHYQASSEIVMWTLNVFLKRPDILMAAADDDLYTVSLLAVHRKLPYIMSLKKSSMINNPGMQLTKNSWISQYFLLNEIQKDSAQCFFDIYFEKNTDWIEKLINKSKIKD